MSAVVSTEPQTVRREWTVAELAERFGSLPAGRIRTDVKPGTGTEEDVQRIRRQGGALCELVDGVLVEKAVSGYTSFLAIEIAGLLRDFVKPRRLGWMLGPDGFLWLTDGLLRAPDISFVRKGQIPGGRFPRGPGFLHLAPALAVEVVSPGNTRREMEGKRAEYFAAGSELVWTLYPETQTVEVAVSPDAVTTLGRDDLLVGDPVLPGSSVRIGDLFDAIDDLTDGDDPKTAVEG